MAIEDLANACQLYMSYQDLKNAQVRLGAILKANQDIINKTIEDIQSNPLFSTVDSDEKKFFVTLNVALDEAQAALQTPAPPRIEEVIAPIDTYHTLIKNQGGLS